MRPFLVFLGIFSVAVTSLSGTTVTPQAMQAGVFVSGVSSATEVQATTSLMHSTSSLAFVGDVMLARRVETYLDEYGADYVYSQLPPVASSTYLVGNFEAAIHDQHIHTPDNTFSFSVDSEYIPALRSYGFTHMSLANNHSHDGAATSEIITREVLTENNINWFGQQAKIATSSVQYVRISDISVGLLAVNIIGEDFQGDAVALLLEEMTQKSDVQIAYMHWGTEYKPQHSKTQQNIAYLLADMGIDLIIGHHPHVVQDVELYNNTLIFYSLGNFIFDQYFSSEVQEGMLLTLKKGSAQAISVHLQGITSIGTKSVPRYMPDFENDAFLQDLADRSSKILKTQIEQGYLEFTLD